MADDKNPIADAQARQLAAFDAIEVRLNALGPAGRQSLETPNPGRTDIPAVGWLPKRPVVAYRDW
jgi:hypothetical protein